MSEEPRHPTSLGSRALDLLIFAPVGLATTVAEEFPAFVAKGRERLGVSMRSAHAVGRFTVDVGQRELERRMSGLKGRLRPVDEAPPPQAPNPQGASRAASPPDGEPSRRQGTRAPESRPLVDLAIPGYDTLPASQVVRRLDSLGEGELDAIERYETQSRGRRTILHRIRQLKEANGQPPGPRTGEA